MNKFSHLKPPSSSQARQPSGPNVTSRLRTAQPKTAAATRQPRQPVAPAAYRPQPIPMVLQRKTALSTRETVNVKLNQRQPVAPAAYRPQALPKVLQTKKDKIERETALQAKSRQTGMRAAGTPSRQLAAASSANPLTNKRQVQAKFPGVVQRSKSNATPTRPFTISTPSPTTTSSSSPALSIQTPSVTTSTTTTTTTTPVSYISKQSGASRDIEYTQKKDRPKREDNLISKKSGLSALSKQTPSVTTSTTTTTTTTPVSNVPKKSWASLASTYTPEKEKPKPEVNLLLTTSGLKDWILGDSNHWLDIAQKKLADYKYDKAEKTICFMWKLGGKCSYELSGGSLTWSERKGYGFNLDKETVCAEENLFKKFGADGWVFSAAYDCKYGWKYACQKGCSVLLSNKGIIDLAGEMG